MREATSLVQVVFVGGVAIDILAGSEQLARVLLSMEGMMWPCSFSLYDVQALMASGAAPESKHVPTLVGSQLLASCWPAMEGLFDEGSASASPRA